MDGSFLLLLSTLGTLSTDARSHGADRGPDRSFGTIRLHGMFGELVGLSFEGIVAAPDRELRLEVWRQREHGGVPTV